MQIDYKSLGSRIKEARKNMGLTQEQLAERADLSTTHISNIENGNAIPSLQAFVNIVNALSISSDELLCDNINHSRDIYRSEVQELLDNCNTIDEVRFVTETMKHALSTFRKYHKQP